MEDSLILLRFNCPDGSCDYIGSGWGDLRLHVRGVHGNLMWYERSSLFRVWSWPKPRLNSDLCIRMKKIFAHEQATYPPNSLPHHLPSIQLRELQDTPKPPDIEAHPMCEFCRECTLGDDELYEHMRQKHEDCFICKRNEVLHQ